MSREMCHCGHTKSSHYLDLTVSKPVLCSCLATGCDCRSYADEDGPKPLAKIVRPKDHPVWCWCYGCKAYQDYLDKLTNGLYPR